MIDDTDPSDAVLVSLADPRRRRILVALEDLEPPASLEAVAAAVEDVESSDAISGRLAMDGGTSSGVGDQAGSVATALYHVHLPKLDETGLVSFDPDAKEVGDWRLDGPAEELL